MKFKEFYPSLLHTIGTPKIEQSKPFVIKEMEISNFYGYVEEEASFKGKGHLHFSNQPKKNVSNSIFTIPTDIADKVGLEMPVLTPVSGTMEFEMNDGKLLFTKYKDIYSDNKLVKFYLPKGATSSIDFQGNLNLKIGLQPYHMIFKFAELLTVNIQGTLNKPVFRLKDEK